MTAPPEPEPDEPKELSPNPFENPFFLPGLLAVFAVWFGYDGFLNAEFIAEHRAAGDAWVVGFNRWGAGLLGALAALLGWRALRGRRSRAS